MTDLLAGKAHRLHFLLLRFAALFLLLAVCVLPAHAGTYDALNADVPFKFKIGDRAFRPGQYQFVLVGNGLVAVRDARKRVIATLLARPVETEVPATTKLVFESKKKDKQLAEIWLEHHSQMLRILGEQPAIAVEPPLPRPFIRPDIDALFERNVVPRFKN
jgi:hypothetical protein